MFGVSTHSQGSVPVRSCLDLVGQLKCVLGIAQQKDPDQRCGDAPRGCGGALAGRGTSRPRLRPDRGQREGPGPRANSESGASMQDTSAEGQRLSALGANSYHRKVLRPSLQRFDLLKDFYMACYFV